MSCASRRTFFVFWYFWLLIHFPTMGGDDDDGDAMASHHGKGSGGASGGGAVGLAWKKAEVRRTRRQMELSRYVAPGKENVPVFCSNVGEPLQRSPLPVGYPRLPLQDITAAILSPLNVSPFRFFLPCLPDLIWVPMCFLTSKRALL